MRLSIEIEAAVFGIPKPREGIPAEFLCPGQIGLLQRGPVQGQLGEDAGGVIVQESLFTPPFGPKVDVERAAVPEIFPEKTVCSFRGV